MLCRLCASLATRGQAASADKKNDVASLVKRWSMLNVELGAGGGARATNRLVLHHIYSSSSVSALKPQDIGRGSREQP